MGAPDLPFRPITAKVSHCDTPPWFAFTLASQAAVSLINNQGDIGETLKDLGSKESVKQVVAAMLSAGLAQGATTAFNLPNPATNTAFVDRFRTYATQATVKAGIQSLVFGTPLEETAKAALVSSLAQSLTAEVGDWGVENKLPPGSLEKMLAHAVVQCAAASALGQDCGAGALGGAIAEALAPIGDQLDQSGYAKDNKLGGQLGNAIASMSAMLVASLAGQDSMTASAAASMVDSFNRQLHPDEAKLIAQNAKRYADKRNIPIEQAVAELTQQVEQNSDTAWDARLGTDNPDAQAFLQELGLGKTMVDPMTGQTYQLFTADATQRDNHAMFAQYSKNDPLVKAELDLATKKAYLPKDAQTIVTQMTGSDMALNDAARDYANMKAQPASVQWSVLSELRTTRLDVLQQYAGLAKELQGLPLTPENALRRGELLNQMYGLEQRDKDLLSASKLQILDMGAAGTLNQFKQRETFEGMGEALGLAKLSLTGAGSASISGRIAQLKGAIADAKAASAEAKATAQAKLDNNFYRDGGTADPTKTMSATGNWKPAWEVAPQEANAMIGERLPSGAQVTGTRLANDLNDSITAGKAGYSPPYVPNTEVVTFTTTQADRFVRVYVDGAVGKSGQAGEWMMRAEDVAGLSAEQIASKYALPQVPTMITDVTVPSGQSLRASVANDIQIRQGIGGNGGGGGVQFEVVNASGLTEAEFKSWFSNARAIK